MRVNLQQHHTPAQKVLSSLPATLDRLVDTLGLGRQRTLNTLLELRNQGLVEIGKDLIWKEVPQNRPTLLEKNT